MLRLYKVIFYFNWISQSISFFATVKKTIRKFLHWKKWLVSWNLFKLGTSFLIRTSECKATPANVIVFICTLLVWNLSFKSHCKFTKRKIFVEFIVIELVNLNSNWISLIILSTNNIKLFPFICTFSFIKKKKYLNVMFKVIQKKKVFPNMKKPIDFIPDNYY